MLHHPSLYLYMCVSLAARRSPSCARVTPSWRASSCHSSSSIKSSSSVRTSPRKSLIWPPGGAG